jgi:hypothetical protein
LCAQNQPIRFPIHHMLVSVLGKDWQKVFIVAFTVYLDDSGTAPEQPIANATALIIPASNIIDMEEEFAALKAKEEFTDFHTSVFVFRNPKYEFANWSSSKQKRVFRRMRQITRKYVAQVFSLAVNKDDYDSIIPAELRNLSGKSHYAWALRHVVPFAQNWRVPIPAIPPYEWIFDSMKPNDPTRKEVEAVMEQAEVQAKIQRDVQGDYINVHFRPRASLAGLQCADLVAWTNYQFALNSFRGKPLHPFARKSWDDFKAMPPSSHPGFPEPIDWNHAITIKRNHLKEWAEKETIDGRSIEWFKAWKEQNRLEKTKKRQVPSERKKR